MAEENKTEGLSDKAKWGIGAVIALLLAAVAYVSLRKAAPVTYAKGAKTADSGSVIDKVTNQVQKKVAVNGDTPLNIGSTGAEVSALQDDLGSLGNAITVDGTWGPETTAAYQAQCAAWNMDPTLPTTLNHFEEIMTAQASTAGDVPGTNIPA